MPFGLRPHTQGSKFSPAAGLNSGQSDQKRNVKKANIEYRIMNVECRRDVICLFKKRLSAASGF